jgi:structural maintenance of chromosome 3 (chondroitin sulfate proteoglycan 6)
LKTIEDRLKTLEDEKEELKEYQKWDRMRRSLEYTIHDRELKETRKKLHEVNLIWMYRKLSKLFLLQMEQQRKNSGESQEKLRNKLQKSQENAKLAMKELKDVKQKVSACKEEKETYQAESQQMIKEKTKLELTKQDLTDEVTGDNNSKVTWF